MSIQYTVVPRPIKKLTPIYGVIYEYINNNLIATNLITRSITRYPFIELISSKIIVEKCSSIYYNYAASQFIVILNDNILLPFIIQDNTVKIGNPLTQPGVKFIGEMFNDRLDIFITAQLSDMTRTTYRYKLQHDVTVHLYKTISVTKDPFETLIFTNRNALIVFAKTDHCQMVIYDRRINCITHIIHCFDNTPACNSHITIECNTMTCITHGINSNVYKKTHVELLQYCDAVVEMYL